MSTDDFNDLRRQPEENYAANLAYTAGHHLSSDSERQEAASKLVEYLGWKTGNDVKVHVLADLETEGGLVNKMRGQSRSVEAVRKVLDQD